MQRSAAHYIFTGNKILRKAVVSHKQGVILSLSANDAMAIEYSNTIFYNGIICPVFTSYPHSSHSDRKVLDASNASTEQKTEGSKYLIKYTTNAMLFHLLNQLQDAGYSLFEILEILCNHNYAAQQLPPPTIEVNTTCNLQVVNNLDLLNLKFKTESRIKLL